MFIFVGPFTDGPVHFPSVCMYVCDHHWQIQISLLTWCLHPPLGCMSDFYQPHNFWLWCDHLLYQRECLFSTNLRWFTDANMAHLDLQNVGVLSYFKQGGIWWSHDHLFLGIVCMWLCLESADPLTDPVTTFAFPQKVCDCACRMQNPSLILSPTLPSHSTPFSPNIC
jgi:hypothetical protein